MADMHVRYFFYSHDQHEEKKKLAKNMNQTYVPGNVMVNGQMRPFTYISSTNKATYADSRLITSGRIDSVHHTPERYE